MPAGPDCLTIRPSRVPARRRSVRSCIPLFLAASLLAFSFPGLAPWAGAAEVQVSCPGPRTGDKRAKDDGSLTYEKNRIYGLGCLEVDVSAASAPEGDSAWQVYKFRVKSKIAPGLKALPHREFFLFDILVGGTATQGEDWEFHPNTQRRLFSAEVLGYQPNSTDPAAFSGLLFDSSVLEVDLRKDPPNLVATAYYIRVLGDQEVESDETVTFTIAYRKPQAGGEADYQIGKASSATFTIRNDDVAPTPERPRVSIKPGKSSSREGASATFTVTATPAPAAARTVPVTVTETGGYATAATHQVTIPTSGTATLNVATTGDAVDEPDGSVTATLKKGSGYTVSTKAGKATVTITDDDATSVTLAGDATALTEGDKKDFTLAIGRDLVNGEKLAIPLTFTGTATRGTDYTLACPAPLPKGVTCANMNAGAGTVTFTGTGSGATATSVTITLTTRSDETAEAGGETVNVGVGTVTTTGLSGGAGAPADNFKQFTINDPPEIPVVSILGDAAVITEGGSATFTLTASPAPTGNITVNVTVSETGSFAAIGQTGLRTVTVGTDGSGTLTVGTVDDQTDEPAGRITATVGTGTGYSPHASDGTASVTVNDNDDTTDTTGTNNNTGGTPPPPPPPSTVRLAVSPNPVPEGEAVTVTLTLSRVLSNPVTIPLTLTAGTADAGDYGTLPRVTIPAGTRTGTGTLSTTRDADADDETVTVAFGTLPSTVTAGTPDAVLLTITDTPTVRLAVSPNPVPEGQTVTVTLTLSRVLSNPVTIPLTLTAGTADAGDYGTLPSVTIPAGALTGTGTLSTVADADPDDETVTVAFGALPSTVTAGTPATVLLTLTDTSPTQLDRLKQALRRMLSAIGRRTLTGALDQLGARLAEPGTGTTLTLNGHTIALGPAGASPLLASLVPAAPACGMGHARDAGAPRCPAGAGPPTAPLSLATLLQASAFTLPLQAANPDGLAPAGPRWALWGRGDVGRFTGRPGGGASYSGKARTGWLGLDARHGPWVAGLAVSHGTGTADYTLGTGDPGRLDTSMTTVHPYGRWTVADGLEVRVVLGAGAGRARHAPETGPRAGSDLTLWLGSLGVRQVLPPVAGFTVAVRADASLTRIELGAGPDFVTDVSADSWRGRAGVEVARTLALAPDTAVAPFVEAAVRRDGGDGIRGTGLEVAGGVRYTAPRVQVEARGRVLAAYTQGGTHEQGVSVTARVGPGAQGRGLSLALLPRWGAAPTGVQALWAADLPTQAATAPAPAALEAQVGYGVGLATLGLLTPFAEAGLTGETARHLRLGARLAAPRVNLRMTLAGEQRTQAGTRPVQALRLDSHWQF